MSTSCLKDGSFKKINKIKNWLRKSFLRNSWVPGPPSEVPWCRLSLSFPTVPWLWQGENQTWARDWALPAAVGMRGCGVRVQNAGCPPSGRGEGSRIAPAAPNQPAVPAASSGTGRNQRSDFVLFSFFFSFLFFFLSFLLCFFFFFSSFWGRPVEETGI